MDDDVESPREAYKSHRVRGRFSSYGPVVNVAPRRALRPSDVFDEPVATEPVAMTVYSYRLERGFLDGRPWCRVILLNDGTEIDRWPD